MQRFYYDPYGKLNRELSDYDPDGDKEGIMNYFHRKDAIKMGYIEGLNNKIKTLIRQHYGYRDKEYLRMKIIQTGSRSLKHYVPFPWVATN